MKIDKPQITESNQDHNQPRVSRRSSLGLLTCLALVIAGTASSQVAANPVVRVHDIKCNGQSVIDGNGDLVQGGNPQARIKVPSGGRVQLEGQLYRKASPNEAYKPFPLSRPDIIKIYIADKNRKWHKVATDRSGKFNFSITVIRDGGTKLPLIIVPEVAGNKSVPISFNIGWKL